MNYSESLYPFIVGYNILDNRYRISEVLSIWLGDFLRGGQAERLMLIEALDVAFSIDHLEDNVCARMFLSIARLVFAHVGGEIGNQWMMKWIHDRVYTEDEVRFVIDAGEDYL